MGTSTAITGPHPAPELDPPVERLAGITLMHISDEPPYSYAAAQEQLSYPELLTRRYDKAQRSFGREKFDPEHRGIWDNRVAELSLYDDDNAARSPWYRFLITQELLGHVRAAQQAKGADLSQNELLEIGLRHGADAVAPDFSAGAINAINQSYYASNVAFEQSARLATMFTHNRPLNQAFGVLIAANAEPGRQLRVKELCSGGHIDHWTQITQGARQNGAQGLQVTLTDFTSAPRRAGPTGAGLSMRAEQYSLFDDMSSLPAEQRYDAMLVTYGFDSVWQPEDIRLTRLGDTWYQTLYRVKVADWAFRREELLEALRQGQPLPSAQAYEYDGIVVETAMEPVDISQHPYGKYIVAHDQKRVNFPGGLIKRVANAFDAQLTDAGIFVSGDAGYFGFVDGQGIPDSDCAISGVAARYRMDDYQLAKTILEEAYGLEVTLLSLPELAERYLPDGWEISANEAERRQIEHNPNNGVMIVKRRRSHQAG